MPFLPINPPSSQTGTLTPGPSPSRRRGQQSSANSDAPPSPAGGGRTEDGGGLSFADIHNAIGRQISMKEANEIVNSITICDPAVGSGHFLVSALNELIAIKSDLGILCYEDADGNLRRFRDLDISVDNDELSIAWGTDPFFEYRVTSEWKENGHIERTVGRDTQQLQKALFREKNILIENCLFGVDINPNSVNICRLRLWIELLKHAYYEDGKTTPHSNSLPEGERTSEEESTNQPPSSSGRRAGDEGNFQQLEVLPNIDINIKQGNSLVSRFELDADLSQILANNDDLTIEDYKQAVRSYKETGDREDKRALKAQIESIKASFSVGLKELHPVRQKLKKQREILIKEEAKLDLFEGEKKSKKEQKKIKKTKKKIGKLEEELEELENASFYDQAFEWRFEFPEVLDEDGNFTGFDVVIGNPPYQSAIKLKKSNTDKYYYYLKEQYKTAKGTVDLYIYFFEIGSEIINNGGIITYITPNKYLSVNYGQTLREYISEGFKLNFISDFSHINVFEEASTYPVITSYTKEKDSGVYSFKANRFINQDKGFIKREIDSEKLSLLDGNLWGYLLNEKIDLTLKIYNDSISITDICKINATSTAKEADELHDEISNDENGFKLINTGTIDPYISLWGIKELRDKGEDYIRPTIPKNSEVLSQNRKKLYKNEKIIFAKIAIKNFLEPTISEASLRSILLVPF